MGYRVGVGSEQCRGRGQPSVDVAFVAYGTFAAGGEHFRTASALRRATPRFSAAKAELLHGQGASSPHGERGAVLAHVCVAQRRAARERAATNREC